MSIRDKQEVNTQSIGICVRDHYNLRFMRYPTTEPLDRALPHALEIALSNSPAPADILLTTSHKVLWQPGNYTQASLEFIQRNRCKVRLAYPLPHDLGSTLATLSAEGVLGPRLTDYHLYTASVTDERNAYVAALLWGKNYAHRYVQTLPTPNLGMAEAAATEWAFKIMPRGSEVMIRNSNPWIGQLWNNSKAMNMTSEIRQSLSGVSRQLKLKEIRFTTDIEKPHNSLARVVREIVGGLYGGVDVRRHR
ncbi:hypothetical protein EHF33_20140 (plasmid) [Deinococcus psychrotolerans]|uniref:Uncharacterized protein n=1 Tax=Deinococcus psychrotolerans TaxID=2489213 RepID=A0A3G8YJ02_9DEIO|nr:hypothetical protein [Deinococcus psychrotolerans]AZI45222.1 hypothetical protein EHF33_20140 [Deinococcus psychrotolerans]